MKIFYSDIDFFNDNFFERAEFVPPEKQKAVLGVKHELSRRESVLAWSLFSFGYRSLGGKPEACALHFGTHGKPYLAGGGAFFSLSHSGGRVLCAFSEAPVGADIQKITEPKDGVLKIAFTESERAAVLSASSPKTVFTKLWTLKESRLKYSGEGVSGGLASADFSQYAFDESFEKDGLNFLSGQAGDFCVGICGEESSCTFETVYPADFDNLFL